MAITHLVARGASRHGILTTGRVVIPSASSAVWRSLVGTSFTSQSFHTTLPRSFLNQTEETEEYLTTPEQILNECGTLYESLTVLNEKLGGTAIPPPSDRATALPFCLLVGNHSSGKSSFINYVLGQTIQKGMFDALLLFLMDRPL
jgi:polynucleotide 5'-kinase involved in rRNA processing